jgi:hypothetical protein
MQVCLSRRSTHHPDLLRRRDDDDEPPFHPDIMRTDEGTETAAVCWKEGTMIEAPRTLPRHSAGAGAKCLKGNAIVANPSARPRPPALRAKDRVAPWAAMTAPRAGALAHDTAGPAVLRPSAISVRRAASGSIVARLL